MFDSQLVLDSLFDGLYTVTPTREITYWNQAAEAITGYRANEVHKLRCNEGPLKHVDDQGNDLCAQDCPLTWVLAHQRRHQADVFLHHKDGHRIPVRVKVAPIRNAAGEVIGVTELFSDNTEQMLALERLAELEETALLDPLTRLANRDYLAAQTQRYLKEMVRHTMHIGVLVLEVDDFERSAGRLNIHQRHGLLRIVAETIRNNCRPFDLFGHVDDGCFVGLIHDVTSNQLFKVGRKLRILIEKSNFLLEDQLVNIRTSVGGTALLPDDTFQAVVARCEKHLQHARKKDSKISVDLRFF